MAKATSGWYPEVDVARQGQTTAVGCTTVQVGPIVCAHLRASALLSSMGQRWTAALLERWHTVDLLCWQVAFLQCQRGSSTQRWQAVDHAVLSVDQASCRVASSVSCSRRATLWMAPAPQQFFAGRQPPRRPAPQKEVVEHPWSTATPQ
ncbi:unnamed protein product [Closterium sp. NIES-53]